MKDQGSVIERRQDSFFARRNFQVQFLAIWDWRKKKSIKLQFRVVWPEEIDRSFSFFHLLSVFVVKLEFSV